MKQLVKAASEEQYDIIQKAAQLLRTNRNTDTQPLPVQTISTDIEYPEEKRVQHFSRIPGSAALKMMRGK